MKLTDNEIAEAFGPDAWHWAVKKGYIEDGGIEHLVHQWFEGGQDELVRASLGNLIVTIAGAYLDDNTLC